MKIWILASVCEREISTTAHHTLEEAQNAMKADFLETYSAYNDFTAEIVKRAINNLEYTDDYYCSIRKDSAYINAKCLCDWQINEIEV